MKVFISWSGERSKILAQAFRDWLPLVLHFVEPWVSDSDIEAGDRWALDVAKELEASNFGVICLTSENVASPWILFESGALSKSLQDGRVVPLLLDIDFKDLTGPLAQFQAKKIENAGMWELVCSINKLDSSPVPDAKLKQLFDALWTKFEKCVADIPDGGRQVKPHRAQHEVLEELVTSIRGLDGRLRDSYEESPRRYRRNRMHPMMFEEMMFGIDAKRNDPIRILMMASVFRDDMPWIYELACETYREINRGHSADAKKAISRLRSAFKALRHGKMMDFEDKEYYLIFREMDRYLDVEFEVELAPEVKTEPVHLVQNRRAAKPPLEPL
jgi:TIR domain